jgi:hypothetical protein
MGIGDKLWRSRAQGKQKGFQQKAVPTSRLSQACARRQTFCREKARKTQEADVKNQETPA